MLAVVGQRLVEEISFTCVEDASEKVADVIGFIKFCLSAPGKGFFGLSFLDAAAAPAMQKSLSLSLIEKVFKATDANVLIAVGKQNQEVLDSKVDFEKFQISIKSDSTQDVQYGLFPSCFLDWATCVAVCVGA